MNDEEKKIEAERQEAEKRAAEEKKNANENPNNWKSPMIEEAKQIAERTEKATASLKEENDRTEKLIVEQNLGGVTNAGQKPKEELSPEKKASNARIKAVGEAAGAPWAKNYE